MWGLLLLLSSSMCFSQGRNNEGLPDDFWTRFEVGFDRFMKTIFDDFSPENRLPAIDSTGMMHTRIIRSDTTIQTGDTLRGSIFLDHAVLSISGMLDGDIVARGGTISMRPGSRITGNVRLRETTLLRDQDAAIIGTLEQSRSPRTGTFEESRLTFHPIRRPLPWASETWTTTPFFLRYNRVEGLFVGLGTPKKYNWAGEREFNAFGSVGYGFVSHRWRGNIGIARQIALPSDSDAWLLEAGVEGYSLTDTKDPWIIGQAENSAAAFFLRADYRDYFQREGFTAHVAAYYRTTDVFAEAKLSFLADRYASVADNTSWALFGGARTFRPNPQIDDGRMRSITANLGVSSAISESKIPRGWTAYAFTEFSNPRVFGGEFEFEKYVVEVRRYQPLGSYDRLNMRLRAGTAHGLLPRQKTYELGGPGRFPPSGFPRSRGIVQARTG